MAKKKGGKPQQGRAKMKGKAQRSGGSPWGKQTSDWSDDDDAIGFRGFGGFTTRSSAAKDLNTQLRHKTIAFISAGSNTPVKTEDEDAVIEDINEELIAAIELNDAGEEEAIPQADGAMDIDTTEPVVVEESVQHTTFFIDTVGDLEAAAPATSTAGIEKILNRPASRASSDSDDEVILFHGRKKVVTLDDPLSHRAEKAKAVPQADPAPTPGLVILETVSPAPQGFTPVPEGAFWRNGGPSNITELEKQRSAEKEDGQEETIEILQAAWQQARKEKDLRKKQTAELHARSGRRGKRGKKKSGRPLEDSDVEDAAYADYLENIAAQETDEELTVDIPDRVDAAIGSDDAWEDTADTAEVDGSEEDDDDSELDDDLDDSDLDSSDLEDELEEAERELHYAEDMLHERRQQAKSDAAIARLWQKQLELGISNDELIIDDGDDDYDGVGDVAAARAGFEDFIGFNSKKPKKKKRSTRDPVFPDASAFADTLEQYGNDGFDIMDYDRPSLRSTKKGRKGRLPPELAGISDDDLRETVRNAWDNDREKKRIKKAEREELRMAGLLGSKNGRPDLAVKYQQGLTVTQVHAEIAVFLQDEDRSTMTFPPMDKSDRKNLHTLANLLNLKSKSIGSGNNRAPVLTKTRATREYSEIEFRRITSLSGGRFLKNARAGKSKTSTIKRSGGTTSATVRHGEIVGAGAKEIGKDSFGHRLMEKMGWSKGQALGKDGEGVLQPVEQMMRVGRAGLG